MEYGTLSETTIDLVVAYIKENDLNRRGVRNNVAVALDRLRKHINKVYGPEKNFFDIIETHLLEIHSVLKPTEPNSSRIFQQGYEEGLRDGWDECSEEKDEYATYDYDEGHEDGYEEGYHDGFEDGKKGAKE